MRFGLLSALWEYGQKQMLGLGIPDVLPASAQMDCESSPRTPLSITLNVLFFCADGAGEDLESIGRKELKGSQAVEADYG